ncbi:MAG TPA: tRNA pseudouridine(55) synthase TruB [Oscillospiraceae bacterium]|nr:tRNA pseudouridine(55) synthase TruB [Oscillospiraceae bacterium]
MNGILNVLKPPGMTSHDVVSIIRKRLKVKKVGHAGTLDPNAAGVLPICIGRATKVSQYLIDSKKEYRVELTLGLETNTEDIYGTVINRSPVISTEGEIRETILSFVGTYEQVPPMYSAIRVKGERLYKLARKGIEVKRKPRTVTIYSIDIIDIRCNKAMFDVSCSKGTYIRTLCKDIGNVLGCGGTMSFLLRVKSGGFGLETSTTMEELLETERVEDLLLPLDFPLGHIPKVVVKPASVKQALNGNNIYSYYSTNDEEISSGTKVRIYIKKRIIGLGVAKRDSTGRNYIKFLRLLLERE